MGLFNVDDQAHIECVRLCFMGVIRQQLEDTRKEWNSHYIYSNPRSDAQSGKPDKMFFLPREFGTDSFHCDFDEEEMRAVEDELENDEGEPDDVSRDFVKLVNVLLPEWEEPETVHEALSLFIEITSKIKLHDDSTR